MLTDLGKRLQSGSLAAAAALEALPAPLREAVVRQCLAELFDTPAPALAAAATLFESLEAGEFPIFAAGLMKCMAVDESAVAATVLGRMLQHFKAPRAQQLACDLLGVLPHGVAVGMWRQIITATKQESATPDVAAHAAAELALASPPVPLDSSKLAELLSAALFDDGAGGDIFDENGTPHPRLFLDPPSARSIDPKRVGLVAAALRCLLDGQIQHALQVWKADEATNGTFMTALNITDCVDQHLQRCLDTPVTLLQTQSDLDLASAAIPEWYVQGVIEPAIAALLHQFELRKTEALADERLVEQCQVEAAKSLKEDQKLYSIAKSKAEGSSKAAAPLLNLLAAEKEGEVRKCWAVNPETSKAARPAQPGLSQDATIAQVMLQAAQSGASFRAAVTSIEQSTNLKVSMVRGSIDPVTKLLFKHRGSALDASDDLLWMSKAACRMAQKRWVRGNVHTMCDVNRALAVADSIEDMLEGVKAVFANDQIEVVDVKDRVNNPTSGGWSDVVLPFRVKGHAGASVGHINELQIALDSMMVARQGMNAHEACAVARYFVEMLFKCGREHDATTEEQRLQTLNDLKDKAIEGLQQDLAKGVTIGTTLSGWLQKRGTGSGIFGRKSLKNRWFVLQDGWLTYHDGVGKLGVDSSLPRRLKSALGGVNGPIELAKCVITKNPKPDGPREVHDQVRCGPRARARQVRRQRSCPSDAGQGSSPTGLDRRHADPHRLPPRRVSKKLAFSTVRPPQEQRPTKLELPSSLSCPDAPTSSFTEKTVPMDTVFPTHTPRTVAGRTTLGDRPRTPPSNLIHPLTL